MTKNIKLTELKNWQNKFLNALQAKGKSTNSLKCYRLDFQCLDEFIIHTKWSTDSILFSDPVLREFDFFLNKKYENINSIRRKLQTFRLFFDYLIEQNLYGENPFKKIASAPKALLPPQPISFEDVLKIQFYLINQIKTAQGAFELIKARRNYLIMLITYHAGLSVSQLSQLMVSDLLQSENSLRVLVHPPKRDPYSVPLDSKILIVLKEYLNDLNQYKLDHSLFFDQLFFNANAHKILKGGLSPRGLEDLFHKISQATETQFTPKSLRQAGIINWINGKQAESVIKQWMGVAPSYSLSPYVNFHQKNNFCLQYQNLVLN